MGRRHAAADTNVRCAFGRCACQSPAATSSWRTGSVRSIPMLESQKKSKVSKHFQWCNMMSDILARKKRWQQRQQSSRANFSSSTLTWLNWLSHISWRKMRFSETGVSLVPTDFGVFLYWFIMVYHHFLKDISLKWPWMRCWQLFGPYPPVTLQPGLQQQLLWLCAPDEPLDQDPFRAWKYIESGGPVRTSGGPNSQEHL